MFKGIKINEIEPEKLAETNTNDNSSTLLNRKRYLDAHTISNIQNVEPSIDLNIVKQKSRELALKDNVNFEAFVDSAFDNFINFNNEKFIESFSTLEVYKNNSSNLIEDNRPNFTDENTLNGNGLEGKALILSKEAYVNSATRIDESNEADEQEEFNNITNAEINTRIKKEMLKMQEYGSFETQMFKKQFLSSEYATDETANHIEPNTIDKANNKTLNPKAKNNNKQDKKRLLILNSCFKCYGTNSKFNALTLISESSNCYLAYPMDTGSITDFHVLISPKEHISSLANSEENLYEETRNYMKSIVAYNLERDMSTIFLEYSLSANKVGHFHIDCIAIKHKLLEEAKMFYKRALLEHDYEWSQNKKLVDTTPYKGNLSKVINENFSYVHVDFNAMGGYLHVIEDDSRFNNLFLKEIIGPLLNKTSYDIKYPKKLSTQELISTVTDYKKRFNYFDWTNY